MWLLILWLEVFHFKRGFNHPKHSLMTHMFRSGQSWMQHGPWHTSRTKKIISFSCFCCFCCFFMLTINNPTCLFAPANIPWTYLSEFVKIFSRISWMPNNFFAPALFKTTFEQNEKQKTESLHCRPVETGSLGLPLLQIYWNPTRGSSPTWHGSETHQPTRLRQPLAENSRATRVLLLLFSQVCWVLTSCCAASCGPRGAAGGGWETLSIR